jgi:hypothetical protein
MSVCIDPLDRTWLHHVDGFLALLRHQQHSMFSHLTTALHSLDAPYQTATSPAQLLTISLLRLRSEVSDLSRSDKHRQLDLLKHRVALKKIYADIHVLAGLDGSEIMHDLLQKSLVVVVAKALMRTGSLVHSRSSGQVFEETMGYTKLARAVYDAQEGIYRIAAQQFGDGVVPEDSGIAAVKMMWPLYAAYIGTIGVAGQERRRDEIQHVLAKIGEGARMPVASGLVSFRPLNSSACIYFVHLWTWIADYLTGKK